jgi:broad specificity phosphatase PhoE
MSRALETACALAETTRLEPRVLVHFCEHRELPDFRGFPRSFLESRYPAIALPDECTEEGWWPGELEQAEALYERARQATDFLRERHEGTDDRVLLVTHGGFASAFISALFDLPPCAYMRFWHDNCAFSELLLRPGTVCLSELNSSWHIPPGDRS